MPFLRDGQTHTLKLFAFQVASGTWKQYQDVECCGVVVEVYKATKYTMFAIDDATAVVQCILWRPARNGSTGGGVSAERTVWMEVQEEAYESEREGLALGCQVKVRGQVHEYKGQRQIKVASLCPLTEPNAETEHRLDTERLFRLVYKNL
ncbi:OB domain-containing protein [Chloropicon primus]|uniref:CST complex subunit STN1 n=1 Tax=Chloropicon primus TaxID=1764295 RepID=A0A5B8MKE6_9CHLO|nr:hypothetical protein A3770_04p34450 [Chloropicon primus]UPR00137.1 OB domain-containing protein [Chloropicon primus]|mmetsp:Transcript_4308/g.12645  ORF Transcript_4308/g.12645 Transcript_4308/m.12645 type:complete len:150 (-) Transcript_4308:1042-1491(-)|eukprot:QDZ20927.1 hypothetical protein A3770_04p34450 [Chloropicon primus]